VNTTFFGHTIYPLLKVPAVVWAGEGSRRDQRLQFRRAQVVDDEGFSLKPKTTHVRFAC
jgi:hypothetical protein